MALGYTIILLLVCVVSSDAVSRHRFKTLVDYINEKKVKPVTTSTLSTSARINSVEDEEIEPAYNKTLNSENNHHAWHKSAIVKSIIDVLVGCLLSCFTGTSFVCFFKYVRNNNTCKISWFTFKFSKYGVRHQVEESIYEEPIELVVAGAGNPAVV